MDIIYALFAFAGWALAWYINEDWYRQCEKLNKEWYEHSLELNNEWYQLCMSLEEKDDD